MSELADLQERMEIANRRQDEAAETLRIFRAKAKDAMEEFINRSKAANEARVRYILARDGKGEKSA